MKRGRRAFLGSLAAAPLVPAALAPPAVPAPPSTTAPSSAHDALAQALAEAVKTRFGAHLDSSELEAVRKTLLRNLERAERLRQTARLGNADEPVSRFEAVPPGPRGARR
ncbi:MAG TPA: hypothetical protein VGB87_00840 [Vicinamibacteria bacterium]